MIQSKVYTKLLAAIGAALAALVLAAPAASAATPAPGYEQFAGCPSPEENPELFVCFRSVVDSGNFQMGSKTAPISKPITFSGGYNPEGTVFGATSQGGLTPVKQEVPGGVIGLTGLDWLVNFLSLEQLKLYAVTELAGQPGPPLLGEGIKLPIKVRLVNPVLGNNCYVGSNSNPIQLDLTFNTTNPPPPNEPISGVQPELSIDSKEIVQLKNGTLVDNAFAAPAAKGCVLTLLGFLPVNIDGLVNLQAGLPSPAGTNETVQHTDSELVVQSLVYP